MLKASQYYDMLKRRHTSVETRVKMFANYIRYQGIDTQLKTSVHRILDLISPHAAQVLQIMTKNNNIGMPQLGDSTPIDITTLLDEYPHKFVNKGHEFSRMQGINFKIF